MWVRHRRPRGKDGTPRGWSWDDSGLRGGWVGWKENVERGIEVREGAGKGEALRDLGWGKETAGELWGREGFGAGAIAT